MSGKTTIDWQPIETAPLGIEILVWPPTRGHKVSCAVWDYDYHAPKPHGHWRRLGAPDREYCLKNPPTHWAWMLADPPNTGPCLPGGPIIIAGGPRRRQPQPPPQR